MIRSIFLFVTLAVTTLLIAACGGTSESGLASIGAQAGPAGAETPAPTVGSTTSDTGLATATATSTPTAEATGSQSATAEVATPAPTVAPTAASIPRTTPAGSGGETAAEAQPSSTVTPAAQAEAPRTLIAQALDSPGLMWCLADKVGMETVLQLSHRAPTAQENYSIRLCFFDKREIAAWDAEWPKRIDAAFAPAVCGDKPTKDFPASYYQGPLIDSHLHIPQLPDDTVGDAPVDGYVETRGAESDLYDTIAKEQRPLLGRTMDINRIACTLRNEGSIKAFAFFPTFPEITVPAIEVAYRTVERYPSLFVPFLQASANGATTLAGESLEVMLGVRPNLFFGFGEVGSSPTESDNPAPDSEIYTGDWEVVRDHGLAVWYHPGEGHIESLERAIQDFPEVTFIVHGDVIRPYIDGILDRNPNVYFTYNDIFDDLIPTFRFGEKEVFVSDMRNDWDRLLDAAYAMYGSLIENHPDRYMWGTDRGDIVWQYDEDIGQLLTEYARAFIGRFDPEIQEMIAYKNAERLIGDYGNP